MRHRKTAVGRVVLAPPPLEIGVAAALLVLGCISETGPKKPLEPAEDADSCCDTALPIDAFGDDGVALAEPWGDTGPVGAEHDVAEAPDLVETAGDAPGPVDSPGDTVAPSYLEELCGKMCEELDLCQLAAAFGGSDACPTWCSNTWFDDLGPDVLNSVLCVFHLVAGGTCMAPEAACGISEPIPDNPECAALCASIAACGVYPEVPSEPPWEYVFGPDQDYCGHLCSGALKGAGPDAGAAMLECLGDATAGGCDEAELLQCLPNPKAWPCLGYCEEVETCGEFPTAFPTEADCVAKCATYSEDQDLLNAIEECVMVMGCKYEPAGCHCGDLAKCFEFTGDWRTDWPQALDDWCQVFFDQCKLSPDSPFEEEDTINDCMWMFLGYSLAAQDVDWASAAVCGKGLGNCEGGAAKMLECLVPPQDACAPMCEAVSDCGLAVSPTCEWDCTLDHAWDPAWVDDKAACVASASDCGAVTECFQP